LVEAGTYRHWKGKTYQVLGTGTHTETGESLVVYQDSMGRIWIRPDTMFSEIMENGNQRFAPIWPTGTGKK
jgi:hypothetical protein